MHDAEAEFWVADLLGETKCPVCLGVQIGTMVDEQLNAPFRIALGSAVQSSTPCAVLLLEVRTLSQQGPCVVMSIDAAHPREWRKAEEDSIIWYSCPCLGIQERPARVVFAPIGCAK
jgi:hypothetical protein